MNQLNKHQSRIQEIDRVLAQKEAFLVNHKERLYAALGEHQVQAVEHLVEALATIQMMDHRDPEIAVAMMKQVARDALKKYQQ